jgi:sulfate/thiosulfate-binding protein
MNFHRTIALGLIVAGLSLSSGCKHADKETEKDKNAAPAQVSTILNVSYDPTRELYKAINAAFAADYKTKTGQDISVQQSHGGSGKQARAVIDGLQADVVTLGLAYDIDALHDHGNLVPEDWQKRLPNNSTPFTSTIVFLVRKGNPKGIKTWDDLAKDGVSIIVANPKTSGGARWAYLAGYGAALRANNNDDAKAREYITKFYGNVPVLDSGARDATVTFTKRELGDVLVSWENEAALSLKEFGADQYEVVYPPVSILAEPPVSVVDQVVDSRGSRKVAEAYLNFLYTEPAQEIAAKNYYRPTDASVAARYVSQFPQIKLFTVADVFGGWKKAQKTHFSDGGIFDQIYKPKK